MLAATAATYCQGKMVEHPKSQPTLLRYSTITPCTMPWRLSLSYWTTTCSAEHGSIRHRRFDYPPTRWQFFCGPRSLTFCATPPRVSRSQHSLQIRQMCVSWADRSAVSFWDGRPVPKSQIQILKPRIQTFPSVPFSSVRTHGLF